MGVGLRCITHPGVSRDREPIAPTSAKMLIEMRIATMPIARRPTGSAAARYDATWTGAY